MEPRDDFVQELQLELEALAKRVMQLGVDRETVLLAFKKIGEGVSCNHSTDSRLKQIGSSIN